MTRDRLRLWVRQEVVSRVFVPARPILCALAFVWRRLLFRTTFVAITGSLGKTTTKECVAACLATRYRVASPRGNQNSDAQLALAVLRVRPWHRYAVLEVAAGRPGRMARRIPFVRPDISVVLCVARTHTVAYPSLEACAAEKALLVGALRPGGLALLNADDARVTAMAAPAGSTVRRFGARADADVRGEAISARWPERLSARVTVGGETQILQTQLVGAHWMPAVLAAVAVARHAGVSLEEAASALRRVEPAIGRLQPVTLPVGATVLRDDYNGTVDTLDPALRVLAEADVTRRVLLVSDFSDFGKNRIYRLRYLGRAAARSADLAIFVGESAAYGRRRAVEAGMPAERVRDFPTLEEAAEFLRTELGPGDLLLLKGRTTDHVTRVYHALIGTIECWKVACGRYTPCDRCWELGARPGSGYQVASMGPPRVKAAPTSP